jgi:hypothetical protein
LWKVPLADALSRLLLALDQQPWRFDTGSPRWHGRCDEVRLTLVEAPQWTGHIPAFEGQLSDDEITAVRSSWRATRSACKCGAHPAIV